jgi:cytoskeletal protein RodZ
VTSFGEKLRNHRENSGLTLNEISESTKIRRAYLEALENNDFGALPGGVFAKGYIRSYAEALGVSAEPLLEAYESERKARGQGDADHDDRSAQDAAQAALSRLAGSAEAPARDSRKPVLYGIVATVGVALAILVSWIFLRDRVAEPVAAAGAAQQTRQQTPVRPLDAAVKEPAERTIESPAEQPPVQAEAQPEPATPPDPGPETVAVRQPSARAPEQPAPQRATQPVVEQATPEPAGETPSDAGGLRVTESGVGTGVVEHRLVGQSSQFTEGARVWFWTRVIDGKPGEKIQHVWLHDGKPVGTIELRLGGNHWRTQSKWTMRPGSAGSWSVEARAADGRVLATAEFRCVAAR